MTKQVSTHHLLKLLFIVFLGATATATLLFGIINWKTQTANAASPRIAYWHLDETSGTTFTDAEAGTHTGACTNCPSAVTGQVNGAQSFDGIDDTINIPAHAAFDWSDADTFAIELWVQANNCTTGNEAFIGRGTAVGGQWYLGCNSTNGTVQLSITDDTSSNITLTSTKVITDTKWHHLAATYDGPNNTAWLYVDGSDIISGTTSFTGSFSSTSADVNIGHIDNTMFFNGAIDEVAIYNNVQSLTDIRTHYYLSRGYTESCTSSVSIMPLGDSITQGISSGVTDLSKQVSYRRDLWQLLSANGFQVEFVGSRTNGEYYQPLDGFDPDHEGWPGWRDDQVALDIYNNGGSNWLGTNPADVILLHIGTNGLDAGSADVEDILNEIDEYEADNNTSVTVILAQIINRLPNSSTSTLFNTNVKAMAEARIANGDKIIIVDMETGAGLNYDYQPAGDFNDYLHPYATGYTKMADVWYNALNDFMPFCPGPPTIVSTPVTYGATNQTYVYDVNANSNIQPVTYSLAVTPTGMTIVSTTGEIQWTPTTTGTFGVTVEVANNKGVATQSYSIAVADPVSPTITSTAITTAVINEPYVYDVEATGVPSPTFSLTTAPGGMTIITQTGRIEWTPTLTGTFPVTVTATNSEGMDTDSFNITVADAPVCPTDMTAYWHLDASISDIFHDTIGSNDASCSGTSCPSVVTGRVNNAVDFDGADDLLSISDAPELDWLNSDSFSVELWVNTTQSCSTSKVFMGKYSQGATWWLGCGNSGNAIFSLRDSAASTQEVTNATTINDGSWHHVVAVRDHNTNENRLYVDGVEAKISASYTGNFNNASSITIGNYDNNYWFDGLIDETAVYSRALTPSEIQLHHTNGAVNTGYCTDVSPAIITSYPVTSAITGQPYSYDVNATGAPTPTYSLTLTPTGMTIITQTGLIAWTPAISGTFNVTVEAANSEGSDSQSFAIDVVEPSAPVFTSLPVTSGFQNQLYTYDVDATGVPNPTFALAGTPPGDMTIDPGTGIITWTPTSPGPFNVTVDATNIAGTTQQIFTVDIDSPPVCSADLTSYWRLDSILNSTTFTDTLNVQDATCSGANCPTIVTGKIGNAAGFDGSNDGLDVANQPEYNWLNNESFSIELWVNTNNQTCSGNKVFVGKYGGYNNPSWWVGCDNNDNVTFSLKDSGNISADLSSTATIKDNLWHHIVAMHDNNANENRLYVDGVEAKTTANYTGDFSNSSSVNIGYYNTGTNDYRFNGYLDEIAIYNRAISLAEVQQHNSSAVSYCASSIAPIIYSQAVTVVPVGGAYSYDVNATGAPTPTYSLSTHPTEMTIDTQTGLIGWNPSTVGEYPVSVQATNATGSYTQTYSLTVADIPVITSTAVTTHILGGTYTYNVDATGYPTPTFSVETSPATSLAIDPNSGEISWTPAITGFFNVTVTAQNIGGQNQQNYMLTVGEKPTITSSPLLTTNAGTAYNYDVNATGFPTPTFALNTAPSGMSIDSNTGIISWMPGSTGTFNVIVAVSNAFGTTLQSFSIEVIPAPTAPVIVSTAVTEATPNKLYEYDVEATGYPAPTFTLIGTPPAGMTIDANSGLITWTPTATGNYLVKVQASNSEGFNEQEFTIAVNQYMIFLPMIISP